MIMEKLRTIFDAKFIKFILVGILNTIVGTGLQFVLFNCTALKTAGNGVIIASSLSYTLASIMSYFLNKYFTFQNKEKGWKPVLKFALNIAVCYILAYGLAQPLIKWIFSGIDPTVQANVVMLAGSCLFVAFNYFGQRFFAFKTKDNPKTPEE